MLLTNYFNIKMDKICEKVHQRHHETREAVTDHITHLEVIIRNIYSVSIQNTEYTH